TWSKAAKKLGFVGQRRSGAGYFVLTLQKPGVPGLTLPSFFSGPDIDWEDIHERVDRPAPIPADAGAISPDGNRVAFRSPLGNDLWIATTDGRQVIRVTNGGQ